MTLSRREFVAGLGAALAGSVTGLRAQATSADLILYNGRIVTVIATCCRVVIFLLRSSLGV